MSQRNKPVISDNAFKLTYPSQQEIDAYVRQAQQMRAAAVADMLRGFWRFLSGRKNRPVGVPSYPAKA